MSRLTLEELYKKAEVIACYYGKPNLADDFKSWYIIKILEGKSQNQLVRHAFIDFIREEIMPVTRLRATVWQKSQEPQQEKMSIDDKIDLSEFIKNYLGKTESMMCYLLAVEGYKQEEIGKMYGKTFTRISQIFKEIGKKNRKIRKNRDNKKR